MPRLSSDLTAIMDQLVADIRTATSVSDLTVSRGWPRQEILSLPYAVIAPGEIQETYQGDAAALDVLSQLQFHVEIHMFPSSGATDTGLSQKMAVHDALADLIESPAAYAGIGMFALITSVALNVEPEPHESVVILPLTIEMAHHKQFGT